MSASGARAPGLRGVCVVAGVGPGNGVAISRLFAERGYQVAMLAQWQRSRRVDGA